MRPLTQLLVPHDVERHILQYRYIFYFIFSVQVMYGEQQKACFYCSPFFQKGQVFLWRSGLFNPQRLYTLRVRLFPLILLGAIEKG